MKSSKLEMAIFAIAMVFIFFSGELDPNTRLIITGLFIVVIVINQVLTSRKKKPQKEDNQK